ncbi:MAG: MOP flippase family protein, partial [Maioricimonas sp. JB049]
MATTTDNPKPAKKPKEDFASSVRWSAFSKYGAQGMQFVISLVLARLLAPEYFGLLGMATVITGFVKIFKSLGFSSAIVQRKQLSDDLLSTLFWVNLGVCLLVATVVLGISPLAAWMFNDPRVTPIVAVLSINFVFAGFTMVPSALLQRRMEFKKLAIREIGGVLAAGLTAIPLAWLGWGVWALVGSTLASSFAQMVLINLAVPFRPRMVYDRQGLSECLKFGLNLTGYNIFNYFSRSADNLIIGLFLGPAALGYYSLAYKLMRVPRDSVTMVVTRVLFPKFSKLQDDDERLADLYLRANGAIAFITFPMMAGLVVLAEPFVQVVLGEKWLPAVPAIWILASLGAIQAIWSTVGQILLAPGRTDLQLRLGVAGGFV